MTTLFFDIETRPAKDEGVKMRLADDISHPRSMKKAETIAKWEKEEKPKSVEEAYLKTALDGTHGCVACIGYAIEN